MMPEKNCEKNYELIYFLIAVLIGAFVLGFKEFTIISFLYGFIMAFILLGIFVLTQKVIANLMDCKIKIKLWTGRRYWVTPEGSLNWDFPLFFVVPVLCSLLSRGSLKLMALLSFDAFPAKGRITRRFYELREFDFAIIASSGIIVSLVLALFARITGFGEFASIASLFALINLIPLGNLNGTKIFFGSRILWVFLVCLSLLIVILINLAHVIATIFITLILAAAAAVVFYYFYEK